MDTIHTLSDLYAQLKTVLINGNETTCKREKQRLKGQYKLLLELIAIAERN